MHTNPSLARNLAIAGLLAAVSFIFRIFSFPISTGATPSIFIGLGYLPVMLSGVLLGPWFGLGVGIVSDVLGAIYRQMPFNPGLMVSSALVGMLMGLFFLNRTRPIESWRLFVAILLSHVVCSILLNTFWLTLFETFSAENTEPFWTLLAAKFTLRAPVQLLHIPIFYMCIQLLIQIKPIRDIRLRPADTV